MRLKRLELAGFKTFADRTALECSPRLTAIVGPNGSGKSNIFDAIRWALGEGSLRHLRGIRTEDVIFAGSERRRPLALAEVILTLDNTDGSLMLPSATGNGDHGEIPTPLAFAEVTVTRRGMRAADSQYMINGLSCRLRDIQTMFLGTGLGGHSYALITQGEVEHMLDAAPEERRMILEEAAGLARYKRRRRDAERRMAAAEQLLLRVADIVGELETRCAHLAFQADAAQRYQAHTQELRTLELSLQVQEVQRLARAQRRLQEQMGQIAAHRREIDETLRAFAEEREALDRRGVEAGRQWDEAQRALVRLTERRSALDTEQQLLAERLRGLQVQRDRIARETERCLAERDLLERERVDLVEAEQPLFAQDSRTQAEVRDAQAMLSRLETEAAHAEEQVEARRDEARTLMDTRARASSDRTAAEAREVGFRDQAGTLGERVVYLAQRRRAVEAERRALAEDEARGIAALEEKRRVLEGLRAEQQEQSQAREALLGDLRSLEIEREALRQRLRYLEEADAQYRGYDAGARELLLARKRDPARFAALKAAVVELFEVPHELRAAVETALGFSLCALIVDSVEDAQALLTHLGEREIGRVTFLPLRLVRAADPLPLPPGAASDPGVRGRAADLVRITGDHAPAVRALLGDVLIARDLSTALRVRAAGYGGCVVTLAGEGLWPQGALTTGGHREIPGSVMGRADEIAQVRASLAELDRAAQEHAQRAGIVTERLRQVDAAVPVAAEEVARRGEARADVARRLTLLDAEIARLTEEITLRTTEQQQAQADAAAHGALRERLAAEAHTLEARLTEVEAETHRLAAQLRDHAGSRREAAQRITDLKVALTELGGKREALRTRMTEIERALARCRLRGDELAGEDHALLAEAARLDAEEDATRTRGGALAQEAADLNQTLAALDTERDELAKRKADVEAAHRDAAGRAEAVAEEAHRVELRQAQVDAEIGSAHRRIEEEFGRPFDRLVGDVQESLNREEALGRIEALRGLIAALGPVNLLAIEEHRQVAVRLEALRAQRDDVWGTVAALRALIAHLEGVIRERFDATYQAVNEEFAALFVRLFGGGRAGLDLVSVEGSDEPGIDIIVQPPGKNLRSLGALSGGERVLVALSLIFAMLRVRPSPFCVFDEVEAALDEANTRKVAEVLRELATKTQIIIITHNKATMEACEVLFGVTMEEPGVSHMVSVRLQDHDRHAESQLVG